MVRSWSTNPCQPLLNTLLGATASRIFNQLPVNRVLSRRKRGFKSGRGRHLRTLAAFPEWSSSSRCAQTREPTSDVDNLRFDHLYIHARVPFQNGASVPTRGVAWAAGPGRIFIMITRKTPETKIFIEWWWKGVTQDASWYTFSKKPDSRILRSGGCPGATFGSTGLIMFLSSTVSV
jgi:hypothetical protein